MRVGGTARVTATKWRKLYDTAGPAATAAMVYGMGLEAERIILRSRPRAPIDTGRLRASGWVGAPRQRGYYMKAGTQAGVQRYRMSHQASVQFGFGADDAVGNLAATKVYAAKQHDTTWYRHPRGGGPFYLSKTVAEAAQGLKERNEPTVLAMWKKLSKEAMG